MRRSRLALAQGRQGSWVQVRLASGGFGFGVWGLGFSVSTLSKSGMVAAVVSLWILLLVFDAVAIPLRCETGLGFPFMR